MKPATISQSVREVPIENRDIKLNLEDNLPWVVRGLVSHWPLVKEGERTAQDSVNYLRQYSSSKPVQAFVSGHENKGRYFYNESMDGFNFSPKTSDFPSLLTEIFNNSFNDLADSVYMGSTSVDYILPGLRTHNDIPQLSKSPLINIWIGNQSRIAAHFDALDNLACVVTGKRKFILFPPDQLENLYVGPLDFTPAGQSASLVDFHNPDFDQFPKFKVALDNAFVAELAPGDALFIPAMWWHHVEGLSDFNILINYWWRQAGLHLGAPHDALFHALLSLKDLPDAQREAWRNMFDYYIFDKQELDHIPADKKGILSDINPNIARQLRTTLINKLNR